MNPVPLAPRAPGRRRLQYRRSRNGCLTCKRRKVRCNEQRPQCYHCQRLNLECQWKDTTSPSNHGGAVYSPGSTAAGMQEGPSPSAELFDFAQSMTGSMEDFSFLQDIYQAGFGDFPAPEPEPESLHQRVLSNDLHSHTPNLNPPLAPPQSPPDSPVVNAYVEDPLPLQVPPILDPVENGPKCASVRALFDSMATSSSMVRSSITAFAAIQLYTAGQRADYQRHYDHASNELSERFHESGTMTAGGNELKHVLTTIFFLTYINFLTGRLDLAYLNLAKAHNALQTSGRDSLGPTEQRIISWIRLLDARAASAGGEGVLVNDTSGIYPPTPTSAASSPQTEKSSPTATSGSHEVIYDMLCQPGITFFQEVQTITGRITRIAHVHRSRGSVEDETEVMAIAADILKDLSSLYDRRPALMDHAASGNISRDTLAEPLALSIIRSFQTYLANFYACYIHLHRVAHRFLARSKAVVTALCRIKEMAHLMVRNNESIPVNMLWPLFLWGSEEDDHDECQWILQTIRSLQHVVTNAEMAGDVLQDVQRRQREAGTRVDIRSVCLELFSVTFAII